MEKLFRIPPAIQSIRPKAEFSCGETYESLEWLDKTQVKPTEQEFDDALAAWNTEYDSQEYARKRREEYPGIDDLTIALYESEDKAAIDAKRAAVKAKWPKDNTGPVE